MSQRQQLKQRLLDFLAQQDPTVLIEEADKHALKAMIDELVPFTAVPDPIKQPEKAAGVWDSLFASFGAKHSDEKPVQHTSNLAFQSFGNLPMAIIQVTEINQEISVDGQAYNNVIFVGNEAGTAKAAVLMKGRYDEDPDNPQRYSVAFYNVSLQAVDNLSDDELREQFGLAADTPLEVDFKPPTLHSDIVYLDDDLRINFGSIGGFYVLKRIDRDGFSI